MERITITIHPASSDESLLRVQDAMAQVMDFLNLYEEADQATEAPEGRIEWRLEHASANSPFTITALADPSNPASMVTERVQRVNAEVFSGLNRLMRDGERAGWMDLDAIRVSRSLFTRNQNGIGQTRIDFGPDQVITIDRAGADVAIETIVGITAIDVESEIPERQAWGEIRGLLVAVGRYFNKPAIQIRSEQYNFVWCILPPSIIEKFGDERSIRDVWEGKTLKVEGRLIYAKSGKLRIEAEYVEAVDMRAVDLDAVLDPDFTSGLDPAEYLRLMHEGLLAF